MQGQRYNSCIWKLCKEERLNSLGSEETSAIKDFHEEKALAKLKCERLGGLFSQGIAKKHIVCGDTSSQIESQELYILNKRVKEKLGKLK